MLALRTGRRRSLQAQVPLTNGSVPRRDSAFIFLLLALWLATAIAYHFDGGGRLSYLIAGAPVLLLTAISLPRDITGPAVIWLALSPIIFPFLRYPHSHTIVTFDRIWLISLGLALLLSKERIGSSRGSRLMVGGAVVFAILFGLRATFSPGSVLPNLETWLDALLLPIVVFGAVRRVALTENKRLRLAGAMACGGTIVGLLGVSEHLFHFQLATFSGGTPRLDTATGVIRVSGPYNVPEVYSLVLVSTLAATLYWYQVGRRRSPLAWVSILVQLAGLALSLFRVSWLSAVIVLVVTVGFRPRRPIRSYGVVLTAGLLSLIALVPLESLPVFNTRLSNTTNVNGRFATYIQAFHIFQAHPLFGVGVNQYNATASTLNGIYINGVSSVDFAHSSFLDVLAEQGLVGILPFVALSLGLILCAIQVWRRASTYEQKVLASAILAAVIGYFAFSGTLTMLPYGDSSAYTAALLALGAGALAGQSKPVEEGSTRLAYSSYPSNPRLR